MGPNRSVALLALLAAAIAGCMEGPGGAGAPPASADLDYSPPTFTDETGALEGVVTDDQLTPLAEAQLALSEAGLLTVSDAGGRFAFSNLAPGALTLTAVKEGFSAGAIDIHVEPGVSVRQNMLLVPTPTKQPHQSTLLQDGLLTCNVLIGGVAQIDPLACANVDGITGRAPRNPLTWILAGLPSEWMSITGEMEWRSTQSMGRQLAVSWFIPGCTPELGRTKGDSPLQTAVNHTHLRPILDGTNAKPCKDLDATCSDAKGCKYVSSVNAVPKFLGTPVDATVVFEQPFTQYATTFFVDAGPENFSALPDR